MVDTVEKVKNYLKAIEKDNKKGKKINALLEINNHALLQAKEVDSNIRRGKARIGDRKLAGLVVAVKSNINALGLYASCASKTLEDYQSTFDATAVRKLKEGGAIIIGMANCDEFACGSSGENSYFGICKNPKAIDRVPGGSSSGSAAAVAIGFCDVALGTDTGGSVRNPASHCGVVGFKPSYGGISRYGLIDLSMSLDQIGILARSVEEVESVFRIIKGRDEKDATTIEIKSKEKLGKVKVGIVDVKADKEILKLISNRVREILSEKNWNSEKISIKHMDLGIQTYYPINYVEFFSGTRKFDGRRFGAKIEDSCGGEVLRRIMGGEMIAQEEFSNRYYKKALDAKQIIKEEFEKAFEKVDVIVIPTVPKLPHKLGSKLSVEDMYNYDALTALANLAEIPAISIPAGSIEGVPVGLQLMAGIGEDFKLLEIAKKFE